MPAQPSGSVPDPYSVPSAAFSVERAGAVLREALASGVLAEASPVAGFLDTEGIQDSVASLQAAFADVPDVTHAFAAKAASLVPVLRLLAHAGMGCEVAGPGELRLAREAGFPAERIVLDSPAKTRAELAEALELGVCLNADNLDELARLDELRAEGSASVLGLRVNPQVGGGSIGAMSTATATSKFGVALRDPGGRESVRAAFARRPWLTQLHAHVGSQGCPLELIAEGIAETYRLAEEINAAAGRQQITRLDIGGGLPVNFTGDEVRPTFAEYVHVLRTEVPALFDGRYALVTEFGRSLLAKNGFIAARVEYAKTSGGRRIVLTHAGAQTATRTVLMPDAWPLRISAYDSEGNPKQGPVEPQDVAGPCCFAGDVVATARPLPVLGEGDWVVLHDTGAYYFSTPWAYNSLPRPAVHGFRPDGRRVRFAPVRDEQTPDEIARESGAGYVGSLLELTEKGSD